MEIHSHLVTYPQAMKYWSISKQIRLEVMMDFKLSTALYVSFTDLYSLWQTESGFLLNFKFVLMDHWLEMGSAMMKQTIQDATLMAEIVVDSAF